MTESTVAVPSWTRYLILCVALAVCAITHWYIFQHLDTAPINWAMGISALVAAWALGAPQALDVVAAPLLAPESPNRRPGRLLAALGFALAVAGTVLLAMAWFRYFAIGWGLVVGGVSLWSYGLSLSDARWRKAVPHVGWSGLEVALFVAVLLVGLFLRFYRYDYFPPPEGVCAVEEPQSGQGANMILNGARPWEFMLDRWMPVVGFVTMGHSLTAIRIPFTVVSWLTIIPLYLLMRELMSRPASLFATFLFAICRWHLIYARHAHAIFGPTLPMILTALWLCVRAYKYGGLAVYPWIGVLTAYTLYAYAGYRATVVFVALFFAISLVHHLWTWKRSSQETVRGAVGRSLRAQILGGCLAVIAMIFLILPLVSQLSWNPFYFFEAADRATDDTTYYTSDSRMYWQHRWDRLRVASMMFSHLGDGSPTFNLPGAPQLDPVSGGLFVVGLAFCTIWALYRFQGYFAFYFFFLFFFGTIFVHNYDVRRLQGIIPLIFITIGYAADRFGKVTIARIGARAKIGIVALAVVLGGLALQDNYKIYFQQMMNTPAVRASFHNTYTVGISYLHRLPDDAYMLMVSDMGNFFTPSDFEWVRGNRVPGKTSTDLLPLFQGEKSPWTGKKLHLLIQKLFYESEEIALLIRQRFPQAKCVDYAHPDHPDYADYIACEVPSEADGRGFDGGVAAHYYRGDAEKAFLERNDPAISFALSPHACRLPAADGKPPCRAVWEGTWNVEESGEYEVTAETRQGMLTATIDGVALNMPASDNPRTDKTAQSNLQLAAGPHTVRVEVRYANIETIGTRLRVRRLPGGPSTLVPFAAFR